MGERPYLVRPLATWSDSDWSSRSAQLDAPEAVRGYRTRTYASVDRAEAEALRAARETRWPFEVWVRRGWGHFFRVWWPDGSVGECQYRWCLGLPETGGFDWGELEEVGE